ncbi:MAG: hypothetical protein ACI9U0_001655, partial [Flavobacteriales bacterium]
GITWSHLHEISVPILEDHLFSFVVLAKSIGFEVKVTFYITYRIYSGLDLYLLKNQKLLLLI